MPVISVDTKKKELVGNFKNGGRAWPPQGDPELAPEGSGSATEPLKVGDVVFGQWTDGNWYLGKIAKSNADGTYGVNYDDGDVSPSLPTNKVRRPPYVANLGFRNETGNANP